MQFVALRRATRNLPDGEKSGSASGATPASARGPTSTGKRLVHDSADRAGTAAALRIATEAPIDLPGGAGRRRCLHGRTHVVVGQDIARTDDHVSKFPGVTSIRVCCYRYGKSPTL